MKIISAVAAVALLSCSFCFQVKGALITGDITFDVGNVTFDSGLATATTVESWTNARVTGATGDFATFQVNPPGVTGDAVTLTAPWIFNPSTATNPLWVVDGFTFALASATIPPGGQPASGSFLNVSGTGTITGHGFNATPGVWSFSIPSSAGGSPFTFISDTVAVPEPSTWVAAALAVFGVVYSQRRKLAPVLRRSA